MNAFPWYDVAPPQDKGGVYELRCYTAKAGQIGMWAEAFQKGLPERLQYVSSVLSRGSVLAWDRQHMAVALPAPR